MSTQHDSAAVLGHNMAMARTSMKHKRGSGQSGAGAAPGTVELELTTSASVDFDWMFDFLATRAIASLEAVEQRTYRRSMRIGGKATTMAVEWVDRGATPPVLKVCATANMDPAELGPAVTRAFDLDAPIAGFLDMAAADPILRGLAARRPGLRLPVYLDAFEGVIRAILGQQVSLAAARTMGERLVSRFGQEAPALHGRAFRAFPAPLALAAATEPELRALGLTGAKVKAIREVSRAVAEGMLRLDALERAPAALVDKELVALPGIGPWTAAYIRMRALGDRDAFPASDLGLVKALARVSGKPTMSRPEIEALGHGWKPWRAYATLHLWASLADPKGE